MAFRAPAQRLLRSPAAQAAQARSIAAAAAPALATLPDLPYAYDALSPVIIPEIMELHHSKHHQTYVNGFNQALEQLDAAEAAGDAAKIVSLQSALKFNGGGYVNHSIFWTNLTPPKDYEPPTGELADAIAKRFGDVKSLETTLSAKTVAVQGSGWGWLGYNKASGELELATTFNQDTLEATTGLVPLLGLDVWEHAYYLQYKNVRPDYLREIWKIVNWKDVAQRYAAAKAQ